MHVSIFRCESISWQSVGQSVSESIIVSDLEIASPSFKFHGSDLIFQANPTVAFGGDPFSPLTNFGMMITMWMFIMIMVILMTRRRKMQWRISRVIALTYSPMPPFQPTCWLTHCRMELFSHNTERCRPGWQELGKRGSGAARKYFENTGWLLTFVRRKHSENSTKTGWLSLKALLKLLPYCPKLPLC